MDFKNKKVAVLGFGTEGASVVSFLLSKGSSLFVFDVRSKDKLDPDKIEEFEEKGVSFQFDSYPKSFAEFDVVVRSPGISPLSSVIEKAKAEEKEITSSTKIFFELCPAHIIGVTGTKGKGTTSSLIYEMLKRQDYDVYLGGNIGVSPLDFLDSLSSASWVVLELSSFQLQDLDKSPQIALVLMVTSEHLDYHRDVAEYIDAKRNILRFQNQSDYAILNLDYPTSNESDVYTVGQVYYVSRERELEKGCYVRDGFVWIKNKDGAASAESFGEPKEEKVIATADILLPGAHNFENACASAMAAYLAGVSVQNIASVLKEFKGLEHRLELVRIFNGVKYYDDSFSTTPETAIAAIEAFENNEILILGGSSKNSDFTELGKTIREAKNIKAIIGIGEEWSRIYAEFKNQKSSDDSFHSGSRTNGIRREKFKVIEGCKNMREIVQKAREIAEVGDVVILSPACASFDMFPNYKERGNQFKQEVSSLI